MNNTDNNVVTVSEMKEIERRADEAGLSYYQMMENAGAGSYNVLKEEYPKAEKLLIFCGKGNNGGDGLVVARLAADEGKKICVILVEGTPVTRDAGINFEKLPKSVKIYELDDLCDKEGFTSCEKFFGKGCDFCGNAICDKQYNLSEYATDRENNIEKDTTNTVIIDALYGTGFHGELRESGRRACELINSLGYPVISLDIPSGCNADSREVSEGATIADITVAFHSYKNVHVPPVINCGNCRLVSIGVENIYT